MYLVLFFITLLSVLNVSYAKAGPCPGGAELAFPGAEGFGRCAQGGRGGVTVDVTNLNDSGAGSLRQCAEVMSGPRTCRIMSAGTVSLLNSDITIRNDYVTIDGSNYPMALKNRGISVRANHVIIRHIRVRPGASILPTNANGIFMLSRESDGSGISDFICDHCSVSWTTDDSIAIVYGAQRATIQDSIISEGLISGSNCGNCSSKAILTGTGSNNPETVSVIRTLSAHNLLRFPQTSGGLIDFVNNVDYNSSGVAGQIVPYYAPIQANFVGNYYKIGIDGPLFSSYNVSNNEIRTMGGQTYSAQSGIFVQDNVGRHCSAGSPATCIIWGDNGGIAVQSQRYPHPLVNTVSAVEAYDLVLNNSGAQPRDAVDARIVNDVRNGTGRWISDPNTVGGWPVLTGGSTPPPSPPPAPPVVNYSLSAPSSVTPGSVFNVQWTAPADHASNDWIGIYPAAQPSSNGAGVTWKYIPAGTSGTLSFTAYATEGSYQIRAFPSGNNSPELANIPLQIATSTPPPPPPPAKLCADGLDNDSDGKIDLADPGCTDTNDDSESPDPLTVEQRVTSLEQSVTSLQNALNTLTSNHADTKSRVDGHDTSIANLSSQLTTLNGTVSTIQNQITELNTAISTLNQSVTAHTATIGTLQTNVAVIQSKLNAMCQALGGGC